MPVELTPNAVLTLDTPLPTGVGHPGDGGLTVSMWIRRTGLNPESWGGVVFYNGGQSFNSFFDLAVQADDSVMLSVGATVSSPSGTVDGDLFLAATVMPGGGTCTLYWRHVDDESLSSVSVASTTSFISQVGRWGGDPPQAGTWPGTLAYCRAWTDRLTESELLAESLSETAVRDEDLWADWPMATAATAETDMSGEGRHLVVEAGGGTIVDAPDFPLVPVPPAEIEITGTAPPTVMTVGIESTVPIPTGGLIGWWRGDDVPGTNFGPVTEWADISGQGNDLTLGGVHQTPPLIFDNGQRTVLFGPDRDNLLSPLFDPPLSQPTTLAAVIVWVDPSSGRQHIIDGPATSGRQVLADVGPPGGWAITAGVEQTTGVVPEPTVTHLVTGLFDGEGSRLLVDGTPLLDGVDAGTDPLTQIVLSGDSSGQNRAGMLVLEAFAWDRALTGPELDQLWGHALSQLGGTDLTVTGTAPATAMTMALDRAPTTVTVTGTAPATEMGMVLERPITSIEITASSPATGMSVGLDVEQPPAGIEITATSPPTQATVELDSNADAPQIAITATSPATRMMLTGIGGPATVTVTGTAAPTVMTMEVGTLEPPVAQTRVQIALDADHDDRWAWEWTTIENRLLSSTPITVNRGHQGEGRAHRPPPAHVELPLRNHDGHLSPDNRSSPWWPHIREGLPVRVQRWHHGTWHTRMTGHVDTIQPREDHYGVDGTATAVLSVSGVLERLAQGAPTLDSPMTRLATNPVNGPRLLAGWPHEDGTDAGRSVSPLPGVAPAIMSMPRASDDTLAGSAPLPHTSSGPGGWACPIPNGPMLGSWHCDWFMRVDDPPDGGLTFPMMVVTVTGAAVSRFVVWLTSINQIWVGTSSSQTGATLPVASAGIDDRFWGWSHWRLHVHQESPTHSRWRLSWRPQTESVVFSITQTISSQPGRPTGMDNLWRGDNLPDGGVSVGQMWVGVDRIMGWLTPADRGWVREPAQQRFWRLCTEERIPSLLIGPPGRSPQMGLQRPSVPVLELLEEAAAAGGMLHEMPDGRLGMRTVEDVLNQAPVVIPRAALTLPLAPVLDTQTTANDVTASIPSGSKHRVQDPEHRRTAGHYDDSIERNLDRDDQLRHHASWRLAEGTLSKTRVPQITVDLTRHPDIATSIMGLRHGDRVQIPEISPTIAPIDMIATGLSEELGEVTWRVTITGRPADVWSSGIWSTRSNPSIGRGRWDSRDTTLTDGIDDQADTAEVVSTGVPWVNSTDHPDVFPLDVEAHREIASVTAITPPQPTVLDRPGVTDQFARSVPDGWGTSPSGHIWQPWGTGDWTTSVTPADGAMIVTGAQGTIRGAVTTGEAVRDSEVLTLIDVDDTEAEVIPWEVHVASRLVDAGGGYRAVLSFEPGGLLVARWQAQSATIGTYADRDRYWVRFRVESHHGSLSVWPDGTAEPSTWMLTGDVIPIDRQPAGQLGIALDVNLFQAARPIIRVREITQTVLTPAHHQIMTLTRPQPHPAPAGTRVRVAEADRWRWATPGRHHHAAP